MCLVLRQSWSHALRIMSCCCLAWMPAVLSPLIMSIKDTAAKIILLSQGLAPFHCFSIFDHTWGFHWDFPWHALYDLLVHDTSCDYCLYLQNVCSGFVHVPSFGLREKKKPLQMKICIAFALFSYKSLLEFHFFSMDHNTILPDMERHA